MKKVIHHIGVWGDSLLRGVVFDDLKGRYATLKNSMAAQCAKILGMRFDNNSRFGATVTRGSQNLTQALERGVSCDAILIEYGGNDCDFNWEEVAQNPDAPHAPRTPHEAFCRTLRDMVCAVRVKGIDPVLMSLPPIDPVRYFNWITRNGLSRENIMRFLGDVGVIYRFQERYSLSITNLAMELRCHYIDVRDAFLSHRDIGSLLCSDGVHPNGSGHNVMRESFVSYMKAFA
ncbi:MAG: SGNH/GDSL hydrolase family protein [Oscillospiraceae bacterium]|nr:SGNH/GDSL hydrolase family protein [Oscillospiraceae bacterium]